MHSKRARYSRYCDCDRFVLSRSSWETPCPLRDRTLTHSRLTLWYIERFNKELKKKSNRSYLIWDHHRNRRQTRSVDTIHVNSPIWSRSLFPNMEVNNNFSSMLSILLFIIFCLQFVSWAKDRHRNVAAIRASHNAISSLFTLFLLSYCVQLY